MSAEPVRTSVGRVDRQISYVGVRNWLLNALTVSSGAVDAISFLALGKVFTAFMTGNIAFLGRIDEQIKVMGYRIEPLEISAVLDQHEAVKESRVASYLDPSGTRRLVAYVVPSWGAKLTPSDLRSFLSTSLPDHMLPSAFVQLNKMPLSVNGKLGRLELPNPSPENILRMSRSKRRSLRSRSILPVFWRHLWGCSRLAGKPISLLSAGTR